MMPEMCPSSHNPLERLEKIATRTCFISVFRLYHFSRTERPLGPIPGAQLREQVRESSYGSQAARCGYRVERAGLMGAPNSRSAGSGTAWIEEERRRLARRCEGRWRALAGGRPRVLEVAAKALALDGGFSCHRRHEFCLMLPQISNEVSLLHLHFVSPDSYLLTIRGLKFDGNVPEKSKSPFCFDDLPR